MANIDGVKDIKKPLNSGFQNIFSTFLFLSLSKKVMNT
ncbi:hypothetical protein P20480_2990 [Pseudoalteromonas sp. BSi20480]|nr:hypothetical protein P20480_2990 [Pseudoalteromonas sp. BSi20480]